MIKVQGDPDHPPTHGALCTKVSRYAERTHHPSVCCGRSSASAPRAAGASSRSAGRRRSPRSRRAPQRHRRAPPSHRALQLRRHHGPAAGRAWTGASSTASAPRCSIAPSAPAPAAGAHRHLRRQGRHAPAHYAESKLILIWGSNRSPPTCISGPSRSRPSAWREADLHRPAQTETADKCHQHIALLPGTDGALALGLMRELIVNDWLDHDYIARHTEGWPGLRERAMAWTPERTAEVCGIGADEVRQLARDYGTTSRRRSASTTACSACGGGNAVRLVAILPCLIGAWRDAAAACCCRPRAGSASATRRAAAARSAGGRTPRTINMVTIGDDLLRESSPASARRSRR